RENTKDVIPAVGLPCVLKQPDSSFSQGVVKVSTPEELEPALMALFEKSDLVIAQEFMPTDFDWRVGIFDGKPLYLCKYYMAGKDWKIVTQDKEGKPLQGRSET